MCKTTFITYAAAALFALAAMPVLSPVPPAQAQWDGAAYEEPGGNATIRFIKSHPAGCGLGFLALILGGFVLIMGPGDLLDSYLRERRKSVLRSPEKRVLGGEKGVIASIIVDDIDKSHRD